MVKKAKLYYDEIKSTKYKVTNANGTTTYELDPNAKNAALVADFYNEDGVPFKRVLKGDDKADSADFSENFGIVFHNIDNMVLDGIELVND